MLEAAQAHLVLEEEWVNGIRSGLTIEKMFDMPEPEELPG